MDQKIKARENPELRRPNPWSTRPITPAEVSIPQPNISTAVAVCSLQCLSAIDDMAVIDFVDEFGSHSSWALLNRHDKLVLG